MIDDRSNMALLQFLILLFVCLLFVLISVQNIDCRYLLEPPFQVRTIYVLRKIPKLVFEKHHFTAIQIAVFSIGVLHMTLQFGEFRLVTLFPK